MVLTEQQQDSLSELINIAFSRTAASLSDLTGQRVLLDPPAVEVRSVSELDKTLALQVHDGTVATVHQPFGGPMDGDAFLLLNYSDAVALTNLLTATDLQVNRLDTSAREVLTEVGNILLNACLGIFGNLLNLHITFAVPQLHLSEIQTVLNSLLPADDARRFALVIYTSFRLRDSAVNGYLVIALGVTSLELLIQAIETLG